MSLWNLKDKTVLIIDDFAQMRTMLSAMLKNYFPKQTFQASNGKEAIELMKKYQFDLVLCDYNLGDGQDGHQILEEAKYLKILPYYTIFIMVTAENTAAMVMGALEDMPDAYLSKPINKTVLISRLQKLFIKKETLHSLSDALDKDDIKKTILCCDALLEKKVKFKSEILQIKCDQLLKIAKYDDATEICESILEERSIPWAMIVLGKVHLLKKNYYDAEIQFREIIENHKNFMPAYDLLAETLALNENHIEAQEILVNAVNISPKSLLRQRCLADIADKNQDLDRSVTAREKVIEIGKSSCLKKSIDYTKLADVYIENKTPQKAVKILNDTSKLFRGNDNALINSKIELALVYKAMDSTVKYNESVDDALKLAAQKKSLLHGKMAINLAHSCMDLGKTEKANEIFTSVIQEHYENKTLMDDINKTYEEFNIPSNVKEIIDKVKTKVIKLNNEGVGLIKKGEISKAIRFFQMAVRDMPEHVTINLNAARSLFINMQQNGINPKTLKQINKYLNVVFTNDPENQKALEIQSQCRELFS